MTIPGATVLISGERAYVERSNGLLIPIIHTSEPVEKMEITGEWSPNRHFSAVLKLAVQGQYDDRAEKEGFGCGICFALSQIESHGNHEVDHRADALKTNEIP